MDEPSSSTALTAETADTETELLTESSDNSNENSQQSVKPLNVRLNKS